MKRTSEQNRRVNDVLLALIQAADKGGQVGPAGVDSGKSMEERNGFLCMEDAR